MRRSCICARCRYRWRGAGLAIAEYTGNAFTFCDGVDSIDSRQLDGLLRSGRPVNLQGSSVSRIAQPKVHAPVV